MTEKIIIYGKAAWPFSEKARSAYGKNAQYVDVEVESGKLEEMLKFTGGERKVPVIVEGEKVTTGYGGTWGVWELTVGGRHHHPFKVVKNALLKMLTRILSSWSV